MTSRCGHTRWTSPVPTLTPTATSASRMKFETGNRRGDQVLREGGGDQPRLRHRAIQLARRCGHRDEPSRPKHTFERPCRLTRSSPMPTTTWVCYSTTAVQPPKPKRTFAKALRINPESGVCAPQSRLAPRERRRGEEAAEHYAAAVHLDPDDGPAGAARHLPV